MGYLLVKWDFLHYLYIVIKKHNVMRKILLLKHIEGRVAIVLHFKNEEQASNWWVKLPCPEEFVLTYEGVRKKSGHRYDLTYSKFDEVGKLYTKHIICFSKKESVLLAKKIKEINPDYITNIKNIY